MIDRIVRSCVLVVLLLVALPAPASAQTLRVQDGGTLTVKNGGVWDLHGATVDLGGTGSTARVAETGGGRFASGQLIATRVLSAPSQANPAGLGAVISSSENLGTTTVTRGHVRHTLPDKSASIKRFYTLSPSQNNRALSATLTFHYADAELDPLSEPALELFKSNDGDSDGGSTWRPKGADSRDTVANTVTLRRIRSFSRWTLGPSKRAATSPLIDPPAGGTSAGGTSAGGTSEGDPSGPAVGRSKRTSLEAGMTEDGAVRLTWRTASETQNADFYVQRKRPAAATWTKVGFVEGADTTSGPQTYALTDSDLPYAAERLTYRLQQVNRGGAVQYSSEVEIALAAPDELTLHGNFPNPFTNQTTIRYELPTAGRAELAVYNALGQRVATLAEGKQEAGRHAVTFEARALPSGVYFVRLTSGSVTRTRKIAVVR